jgi:hypothetical protein
MIRWIRELLRGLSKADAYTLCSLAADFCVTQMVNMAKARTACFRSPFWADTESVQPFLRGSNGVTLGDLIVQDRPDLQRRQRPHAKILASCSRRAEEPAFLPRDRRYFRKDRGVYGGQIGS